MKAPILIGDSPQILKLRSLIRTAAQCRFPVLISGEPGTGKDLVAREIHSSSRQNSGPFVTIDGPPLSASSMAQELFGVDCESLREADAKRTGLLTSAGEGTVYLDEITEFPIQIQARLLRVFERREFRAAGTMCLYPFRARVIAATNRKPEVAIRQGDFHQGLYYHLNQISIAIPPLRERSMDIPLLAKQIVNRLCIDTGQTALVLSQDAVQHLVQHDWPGNIRELETCLARLIASEHGSIIRAEDLVLDKPESERAQEIVPLPEVERNAILNAVSVTRGDKTLAARLLGIGKTTLYRKLKSLEKREK